MAEPVRVRRLIDQEGQKLQQIVRRGSSSSVRYRRAMMLLASAGGNTVPVIAQLVQADEDTVRDVIHRCNEIGLACLDPRWAGHGCLPVRPGQVSTLRPDPRSPAAVRAAPPALPHRQLQPGHRRRGRNGDLSGPTTSYAVGDLGDSGGCEGRRNIYRNT